MRRREVRASLSGAAQEHRLAMWAAIGCCAVLGLLVFAALKRWIPRELALPAFFFCLASAMFAAWLGYRGHRQALADRERQSRQAMTILIAAQLARQDDEKLVSLARMGGPAAEAATMILAGRRQRGSGG